MGEIDDAGFGFADGGDIRSNAAKAGKVAAEVEDRFARNRNPSRVWLLGDFDDLIAKWRPGGQMAQNRGETISGPASGCENGFQLHVTVGPNVVGAPTAELQKALGSAAQIAERVDFPQPVAGPFLELAQQEFDDGRLFGELLPIIEILLDQPPATDSALNDDKRESTEQDREQIIVRPSRQKQGEGSTRDNRNHVIHHRRSERAQREGATGDQTHHDRGDDRLPIAARRGIDEDGGQ
ncbi:hypothetical protein [Aurantimonas sp. A3-2-R12]|uniref:hypothetical protein n=1 Tax=Aurantimonas sp. A3-2-R12 TaxID=3114362 RepID=UPI002E183289|nr:hypothetical protein [Aurantimonas sp. A3-2-R12]